MPFIMDRCWDVTVQIWPCGSGFLVKDFLGKFLCDIPVILGIRSPHHLARARAGFRYIATRHANNHFLIQYS